MPRVHCQRAAKDYPHAGIKKGDTYYKWSFRYGGTHMSKTYPRPSQLTQSKYGEIYAAQEEAQDSLAGLGPESTVAEAKEFQTLVEAVAEKAQEVADEYAEAAEQFGGGGPNQEHADACESTVSNFESAASDIESIIDNIDEVEEGTKPKVSCGKCDGSGTIWVPTEDRTRPPESEDEVVCPECGGEGEVDDPDAEPLPTGDDRLIGEDAYNEIDSAFNGADVEEG